MSPTADACHPALIDQVRTASRQMVRELGFMQATLAATDYPPSAVHTLLEIGAQTSLTAAELAELLQLEKSSVSRLVRKLIEAGELKETISPADARAKLLVLTAKGRRTLKAIHAFASHQVTTALAPLPVSAQQLVGQGLATYAAALEGRRRGTALKPIGPATIQQGYQPGVIGRIVEMHADFYARHFGFGQFFESLVATGVAGFAARLERPCNALWVARQAGRIAGSVAIDGEDLGPGKGIAHLRWFIVDDSLRGAGMGRKLLDEALAFCDRQAFSSTHLWTFRGLDAARRLYEVSGFVLQDEKPGTQWGAEVVEQCFVRPRPVSAG